MSIIENSSENDLIIEGYTNINDLYKIVSESVKNDMAIFKAIYESDVRNLAYAKMLKEADGEEEKEEVKDKAKENSAKTKMGILETIRKILSKFFEKISSVITTVSIKLYKFFVAKFDFAKKNKKAFDEADVKKVEETEYYPFVSREYYHTFRTIFYKFDEHTEEDFRELRTTNKIAGDLIYNYDIERTIMQNRQNIHHGIIDKQVYSFKEFRETQMKKEKGNPFNDIAKDKLWNSMTKDFSIELRKMKKGLDKKLSDLRSLDGVEKLYVKPWGGRSIDEDEYIEQFAGAMVKYVNKMQEYHGILLNKFFSNLNILNQQDVKLFKALLAANKSEPQNASALDLEVDELCEACNECFYGE